WRPSPGRSARRWSASPSPISMHQGPRAERKLTPDYNLGCTRIPKSDKNYCAAVQLPKVQIVKGQIARILPEGVVMADGTREELDVLVCATGFDAHAYMRPMKVTGLNGTTIDE